MNNIIYSIVPSKIQPYYAWNFKVPFDVLFIFSDNQHGLCFVHCHIDSFVLLEDTSKLSCAGDKERDSSGNFTFQYSSKIVTVCKPMIMSRLITSTLPTGRWTSHRRSPTMHSSTWSLCAIYGSRSKSSSGLSLPPPFQLFSSHRSIGSISLPPSASTQICYFSIFSR